jgi:hypothetical protein
MPADDARRQLLEHILETQSPDLPAQGNLPVGAKSDEVKNLLADVDTNDCYGYWVRLHLRLHGCFSCSRVLASKASPVGEAAGPSH